MFVLNKDILLEYVILTVSSQNIQYLFLMFPSLPPFWPSPWMQSLYLPSSHPSILPVFPASHIFLPPTPLFSSAQPSFLSFQPPTTSCLLPLLLPSSRHNLLSCLSSLAFYQIFLFSTPLLPINDPWENKVVRLQDYWKIKFVSYSF